MKRYNQIKEFRFDPFKAWYFPDQDNFIKFPPQHDHLEFVKSLTDAYEKGYVRIYVSPTEIICESNELPSNSLYIKVLKILQKEIQNLNDVKYITWGAVKSKSKKFKITEAVNLSKESKVMNKRNWKVWTGDKNIVFHETSQAAGRSILENGFSTGKILNTGETTNAVYASQVFENSYVRNSDKGMRIPLNIKNLKLLNTDEINNDINKKSFEQEAYIIQSNAEDGIFPQGYDGIISYYRYGNYKGKVYECVLKPLVATKKIIKNNKLTEAVDLSKLSKEELEDLKVEIRSQPFLDPKDMRLIKEIDSILIGFDVSDMKFGKFKKSKRVTPFNRNRT